MRIIYLLIPLAFIAGCSTTLSKGADQVKFHSQVSTLLDDCKKLGTIKIEYTTQPFLSVKENEKQAQNEMRRFAYDNFKADNVAYTNQNRTEDGFVERAVINAEGVAFKCGK